MNATFVFKRSLVAQALCVVLASPAWVQAAPSEHAALPESAIVLPTVVVSASTETQTTEKKANQSVNAFKATMVADLPSEFSGFADAPLSRTPISIQVVGSKQIQALGAKRLADLNTLDAAISDAYTLRVTTTTRQCAALL
jgi:outer membrane receptor protein involved in Fe transport